MQRSSKPVLCMQICMHYLGKCLELKLLLGLVLLLRCGLVKGVSGADRESVFVMEGDSVTLDTGVIRNQQEKMTWYYNDTRIALITGDQSKICADDQCDGRFRDRLKLDNQTGSLTITDIRTTDSGDYHLLISSSSEKIFDVTVQDAVFVIEGDSVTLRAGVKINQQEKMTWYYDDTRIALINGGRSKICTDDQCDERFRDRLKLDNQTGSLTITDTRTTDSGDYKLLISSSSEKIFKVVVQGAVVLELHKMKTKSVNDGESVTLDPGVMKPNDVLMWYFNDILIAEMTGDQSEICTDDQCKERFRDRLKVNQTGSLTITDTRTTDSGLYKLQINSSRNSIVRVFSVTIVNSGLSSGHIAGIIVVVLLAAAAAGVIYYCHLTRQNNGNQGPVQQEERVPMMAANGTSSNHDGCSLHLADADGQ